MELIVVAGVVEQSGLEWSALWWVVVVLLLLLVGVSAPGVGGWAQVELEVELPGRRRAGQLAGLYTCSPAVAGPPSPLGSGVVGGPPVGHPAGSSIGRLRPPPVVSVTVVVAAVAVVGGPSEPPDRSGWLGAGVVGVAVVVAV